MGSSPSVPEKPSSPPAPFSWLDSLTLESSSSDTKDVDEKTETPVINELHFHSPKGDEFAVIVSGDDAEDIYILHIKPRVYTPLDIDSKKPMVVYTRMIDLPREGQVYKTLVARNNYSEREIVDYMIKRTDEESQNWQKRTTEDHCTYKVSTVVLFHKDGAWNSVNDYSVYGVVRTNLKKYFRRHDLQRCCTSFAPPRIHIVSDFQPENCLKYNEDQSGVPTFHTSYDHLQYDIHLDTRFPLVDGIPDVDIALNKLDEYFSPRYVHDEIDHRCPFLPTPEITEVQTIELVHERQDSQVSALCSFTPLPFREMTMIETLENMGLAEYYTTNVKTLTKFFMSVRLWEWLYRSNILSRGFCSTNTLLFTNSDSMSIPELMAMIGHLNIGHQSTSPESKPYIWSISDKDEETKTKTKPFSNVQYIMFDFVVFPIDAIDAIDRKEINPIWPDTNEIVFLDPSISGVFPTDSTDSSMFHLSRMVEWYNMHQDLLALTLGDFERSGTVIIASKKRLFAYKHLCHVMLKYVFVCANRGNPFAKPETNSISPLVSTITDFFGYDVISPSVYNKSPDRTGHNFEVYRRNNEENEEQTTLDVLFKEFWNPSLMRSRIVQYVREQELLAKEKERLYNGSHKRKRDTFEDH